VPKYAINDLYNGLTSQPPVRTQPGAVSDIENLRLAIDKGATTRNGTTFVRFLTELPSPLDPSTLLFVWFKNDLIVFGNGTIYAFNGTTGAKLNVNFQAGTLDYLYSAPGSPGVPLVKSEMRTCQIRNSIVFLNRTKITATSTSSSYTSSGEVDFFSDLSDPLKLPNPVLGHRYRVRFAEGAVPVGYYLRVEISGVLDWQRIPAPNQPNAIFDRTSMPHRLIRNSSGSYTFQKITWTARRSGNDETNPAPIWIGEKLYDVAYHASRLFLVADGVISATSNQDLELLYLNDIDSASVPTNPVEHNITSQNMGIPLYSASIGADLFLSYERGQLSFTAGQEQLTNINGNDLKIGDFKTKVVIPANNGASIVMLDEFNSVQEFSVSPQGYLVQSGDLSSHVLRMLQGFTPIQVFRFQGTTFIPTEGKTVFVHEKTIDAGDLVQTGWTKFNFNVTGSDVNQVYTMNEQQGTVSIVLRNDTNGFVLLSYVHREEEKPSGFVIAPCADFREFTTGEYLQERNVTRFNYLSDANEYIRVFTSGEQPEEMVPVSITNSYVEVLGNVTVEVCIGQRYFDFLEFNRFYPGASTVKPTISSMAVFYQDTLSFDLLVQRAGAGNSHTLRTYNYKTQYLLHDIITNDGIKTGHKVFNILQDGRTSKIRIEHTGLIHMTINAIELDLRFSDKSAR